MPPLSDIAIREQIEKALSLWEVEGYITWKSIAREWVERNLEGIGTRRLGRVMYDFVRYGGEIDQIDEQREGLDVGFHYDIRPKIAGKRIYVEMRLENRDADDPSIFVVSIHDA